MFSAKRNRIAALTAALALVLGATITSCEKKTEDQGSGSPNMPAPPVAEAPPAVNEPPAAPEPVQQSGPCPSAAYDQYSYAGPGTTFYPQDRDYSGFFAGFNLCRSRIDRDYVLYNNSSQVWVMAPSTIWAFAPQTTSEATFFRAGVGRGDQQLVYVVPGEAVKPASQEWPGQIAWAPEPTLTSGWLGQKLALENLDINAESGNLDEGVKEFILKRQLKASNPAAGAIYSCIKSGQEAAADAAKVTDETGFAEKLKLGLGATQGTASCAGSLKELYKDPEKGQKNWLKILEHSSGGLKQGITAEEALRPIMAACHVVVIPKIGRLRNFCP
ncbi:hypothetical protein [Arthrobacter sp. Soil761]|uniref:hypothetical protein n=1 Tax=Arthrobacter sp. Soil761 TaxID=1736400 RepID=UPI000A48B52A|nr:hypothetical protein [Arthrobacter sp. Soil761]